MANWAALWKRHGIAPFATQLECVDSIQPSRFSRKYHVNVFTERTYVPHQPRYVFQWQSKENLYHSQIATFFHCLAALPLIYGPLSLLGSISLCAIEISSAVPREQLVLFHPWQPRYWTSPMPVFFFSHLQVAIAFCLPSKMNEWLSWFRFYFFYFFFLSFGSMSLRVIAEDRNICKSRVDPFISDHVFLGWFISSFCSPQVKWLFSFIIPVTRLSFSQLTAHTQSHCCRLVICYYFPVYTKTYSFQYAHRLISIHSCAQCLDSWLPNT